jgi:mutator protein MutT
VSPIPIAIAVVEHAGQVLIGQRPAGVVLAGYWEFPGGKVGEGESPAEAAARECLEETGLTVEVGPLLDEVEHAYEHGLVHLYFFSAVPVDPARLPRNPYQWVDRAAMSSYRFPAANASILARLLEEPPK